MAEQLRMQIILKAAVCELSFGQSIQRREIMRRVVVTKRVRPEAHSHERDPRHSAPADRRRRQAGRPVAHGVPRSESDAPCATLLWAKTRLQLPFLGLQTSLG